MLNQSFPELQRMRLDRRQPVANQIFDHLRREIVSLRLAPGTVLSRPALAESFGVSQTPIRDALLRLEAEALVTVHPQSSTMVAPIDVEQAHEAQFLRIALECEVSRTIARFYPRIDEVQLVPLDPNAETVGIAPLDTGAAELVRAAARASDGRITLLPHPQRPDHYIMIKRSPNNS